MNCWNPRYQCCEGILPDPDLGLSRFITVTKWPIAIYNSTLFFWMQEYWNSHAIHSASAEVSQEHVYQWESMQSVEGSSISEPILDAVYQTTWYVLLGYQEWSYTIVMDIIDLETMNITKVTIPSELEYDAVAGKGCMEADAFGVYILLQQIIFTHSI